MLKLVGIIGLAEVDPAGRAGGNHRKSAAVFHSVEKLGALLHDGEVGAEVGVIDLLEAEAAERRDHFSGDGGSYLHSEFLAEGGADCGSGLDYNVATESHCLVHLVNFGFEHQRAGGANAYALSAEYAGGFAERTVSGRTDDGVEATVLEAENAEPVGVFASCDAASAKNTFAGVADYGRVELVNGDGGLFALEHSGSCAGELRDVEKLTAAVFVTLLAVNGVVGEKKLHGGAAGRRSFRRGDADFHALGNRVYAGSHEASHSLYLNEANAAGALVAFAVIKVAKRGNLVAAVSCGVNNGKSLIDLIGLAFDFNINFAHSFDLPIILFLLRRTCRTPCTFRILCTYPGR